jgi:type IV fimbrial biogenesis protein FimT
MLIHDYCTFFAISRYSGLIKRSLSQRGFTLIELMVTIALVAILATLAAPSFQQTIASSRLTTATNDLYTSLVQARSEAIKQGERVTVCKSDTTTSCSSDVTTTWSVGWITFVDGTRTTAASVDTGETVRYVVQAMDSSIVIRGNSDMANYVSYSPDGQSKSMTNGFLVGKLQICSTSAALTNDNRARLITINIAGRATISKPTGIAATCAAPT